MAIICPPAPCVYFVFRRLTTQPLRFLQYQFFWITVVKLLAETFHRILMRVMTITKATRVLPSCLTLLRECVRMIVRLMENVSMAPVSVTRDLPQRIAQCHLEAHLLYLCKFNFVFSRFFRMASKLWND